MGSVLEVEGADGSGRGAGGTSKCLEGIGGVLEGSGEAFGVEEKGEGKVDRAWGQDRAPGAYSGGSGC